MFALMFALVLVSAGSVMAAAANVSLLDQVNGKLFNPTTNKSTIYLLNNGPTSYAFNMSINVTPLNKLYLLSNDSGQAGAADTFSTAQGAKVVNLSSIRITLPSMLSYVVKSANLSQVTAGGLSGNENFSMSANFSYSGQVLTWTRASREGINVTNGTTGNGGATGNHGNATVYNLAMSFNATATAATTSAQSITVEVLYDYAGATWETLTTNFTIQIVNLTTAKNTSVLRWNEDTYQNITININNSNIMNYPGDNNRNSSNIVQINFTLSGPSGVTLSGALATITAGDVQSGGFNSSSANKRGTIINWTRYNETRIVINNGSGSSANATLINGYLFNQGINNYFNTSNNTFTFQVYMFQPGNYTLTIMTYDNSSRTNITVLDITVLDTTKPSNITFSCSPVSLYLGEIVTCTCSPSWDNYYPLSALVSSITDTDTASTGTFTETCTVTDGNGNQNTATASYTVNSAGSSESSGGTGGGAGSGYEGATTHNANTLSASTETTLSSKAEENIEFETTTGTTAGTSFIGTVDAVTETSATLTIVDASGENKAITVDVGSVEKVDLDGDNVYDLSISLSSVTDGKAKFAMKEISETVPLEEREEETTEEGAAEQGGAEETTTTSLTLLWVALGVVAVVAIIFFLTQKKKSPVAVFLLTLFAKNAIRRRK